MKDINGVPTSDGIFYYKNKPIKESNIIAWRFGKARHLLGKGKSGLSYKMLEAVSGYWNLYLSGVKEGSYASMECAKKEAEDIEINHSRTLLGFIGKKSKADY